ncbi:MAG: preprotein translocase subunit SecA [Candidatus Levybacteria bacterium]|nr:preprotein translocase subunit SecA [Candidatus Levybacteria bacterium]
MLQILQRFFSTNEGEIRRFTPIIDQINVLEEQAKKLKDKDFAKKTEEFRTRIKKSEKIELLLPEAFALVREASRRVTGLRHYDVQLMAAIALSEGKNAEQKTGEGKTLSAVPALYLNSLTGRSVHLVTVNDYLARRDAGWMGPIFHLLGVSVASMISERSFLYDPSFVDTEATDYRLAHLKPITRKEAYQADVVYGINSEYGFDYLRDNMAGNIANVVQRDFYFAIVDEVDSVLIDEARTPHIISQPDESPSERYYEYAKLVNKLSSETDYKIDEKLRTAHLTDHGIGKIEKLYGIANIYEKDFDTVYHLEAALKARTLFHREKEYIVRDEEVILVDEFTGRLLPGRRLSDGIHQAIEAKENVPIQRESKTLATVSLQNYFRMYEKLAGMTGTALTEAEEFKKIYKLDVIAIPTNNPVVRQDFPDAVYKTARAKLTAVAKSIEEAYKKGQPVLVGTTSIDKNEIISQLLTRKGIRHAVLNAKNHLREAEIIAEAGKKGAVTVATNMAGRGVDIILGGETPKLEDGRPKLGTAEWKAWQKAHDEVVKLGGLYVIGTERHESRRIDNQLRGRSGRQGDPGASRFFVGLDDDIMRIFGGDKIAGIMTRFNMPEDVPLEHSLVSRAIENAQVKVEKFNFDSRKHLVEYDDVLNKQREIIYRLRREILETGSVGEVSEVSRPKADQPMAERGEKNKKSTAENEKSDHKEIALREQVLERVDKSISMLVAMEANVQNATGEIGESNVKIVQSFATIIPFDDASQRQLVNQLEQHKTPDEKTDFLVRLAHDIYSKREESMGKETMRQIERFVMLSVIDNVWMNHLDAIDHLREGIRLQAYAQKDPLVEYKNEAYRMFERLLAAIDDEAAHQIYRIHVHDNSQPSGNQNAVENTPESEVSEDAKGVGRPSTPKASADSLVSSKKKLGRNDPCWCGSGKKWKRCHYPN